MRRYVIRFLPGFTDHNGDVYADRWAVTLKCSRGLSWDGGEYATRSDAVDHGERAIK